MEQQARVRGIIAALKDAYPDPFCALHYKKDYELMIAVRLSARVPTSASTKSPLPYSPASRRWTHLPTLDVSEVEEYVRSCGFISIRRATLSSPVRPAARKVRRQGARHKWKNFVLPGSRAQERQISYLAIFIRSRPPLRLRHALHPHHKPSGALRGQGPGKGRNAAARDSAAGGVV